MENEQLATLIRNGNDKYGELMLELWEKNVGFATRIANQYKNNSACVEFDDLMQECFIGMCEAVRHWNQNKGVRFMTYAKFRMKKQMERSIAENSGVGQDMFYKINRYRKTVSEFEKLNGRKPDKEELTILTGIPEKDLDQIEYAAHNEKAASLDKSVSQNEDCALGELVPSGQDIEDDTLEAVHMEELRAVLWPLVDSLPGMIPAIIRGIYQDGKSPEELSQEQNCSCAEIQQGKRKGLKELRQGERYAALCSFREEYITTHAFHGGGVEIFNRTWTSSTERIALQLA